MSGTSNTRLASLAGPLQLAGVEGRELPGAFESLYRQHFDFVFRSVRRLGVDEGHLDDVVQEVFLVALRRMSEFRPGSNARAWLFSIASRIAANHRRKQRTASGRAAPLADYADDAPGPFERAERVDAARVLQRFLNRLSDDKRDLFILSELEGMTGPELAETCDSNLNTVYWRLRSLRQQLADYLEASGALGPR
jgi:RNA polymerase sigma-70 factor (ECF subfamily)